MITLDGTSETEKIAIEVEREVRRAMQLHRGINSLHEGKAVIEEQFDEFWEQVKVNPKKLSIDQQQIRLAEMRNELIQIAAMAIRTIVDCKL